MTNSTIEGKKATLSARARDIEGQLRGLYKVFQRIKKNARTLIVGVSKESDESRVFALRKKLGI